MGSEAVAMAKTRHLRVVDAESGEVLAGCPSCENYEAQIVQFERTIRTLNGRLTKAERDREAEARAHKLWPEVECLHEWWAMATGHEGCKFGAEEFYQAVPRLKEHDPIAVLQGIAGIAYDPNTKERKNGGTERYDSWELLCKSGPKMKRYQERAIGWPANEHKWKHWLIDRIEGSFKDPGKKGSE